MTQSHQCIVCNHNWFNSVFSAQQIPPVLHVPIEEKDFPVEVLVDMEFVQCKSCGLIQNSTFDSAMLDYLYRGEYSAAISTTKEMLARLDTIAEKAIGLENIAGTTIVEIGASDFCFAELMIVKGAQRVIAYEPSNLFSTDNPKIVHIQDFFIADQFPIPANDIDLIVMRHVFEHLPDPLGFLENLAANSKPGMKLYIEVPNVEDILANNVIYDFFYEHVTYYTADLLERMVTSVGFNAINTTPLIGNQHIGFMCEMGAQAYNPALPIEQAGALPKFADFKNHNQVFLGELHEVINTHQRVAIYGAGAHGVGLAALLGVTPQSIECFLDLNPMKTGKYAPKTHIPIISPVGTILNKFDCIIIIATLHQDDIARDLRDKFNYENSLWGSYPMVEKL